MASLPYEGIRVLDLAQGLAGPYCGMLLAQWGANVVKLEPVEGDWLRGIGARHGDHSALSLAANRGKRSVSCDLKDPRALQAVRRIACQCDVVLESFRPGVVARLGLGYEQVRRDNPDVVYLSVSGFGQQRRYAQQAGSDSVLQAFSGMMALNADAQGTPQRVGFLAVDTLTGLYAFQAVAAALHARLAGQGGRYLDIGLMQATAAFLAPNVIQASLRPGEQAPVAVPSGAYRAADGYLTIALSKESHFPLLCRVLGRDDLAADPRYASFALRGEHAAGLRATLQQEFSARPVDGCVALLQSHGLLVSRVNTVEQWLADPDIAPGEDAHMPGSQEPFRMPETPGVPPPPAGDARGGWPSIGGAATQVLADFGFGEAEAGALVAACVLV